MNDSSEPLESAAPDAVVRDSDDGLPAGRTLSRRTVLKGVGTAGGLAVAGAAGHRLEPVGSARAVAPLLAGAGAAKAVAYLAGGALVGAGVGYLLGDSRDYSGYSGADALHGEIETGALEMQSADERVMTSISNNIEFSENVALPKGKYEALQSFNAGASKATAEDAMQDAVDGYYSDIQRNIITHHNEQLRQLNHHFEQVDVHADLEAFGTTDPVLRIQSGDGNGSSYDSNDSAPTNDGLRSWMYSLVDGDQTEVDVVDYSGVAPTVVIGMPESMDPIDEWLWGVNPMDGTSTVVYFAPSRYMIALSDVVAKRDALIADLTTFIDDLYTYYSPGEVQIEDFIDPITAATQLGQDFDDQSFSSAFAAMMGIPTTGSHNVLVYLESDAVELWSDIYTDHTPLDTDGNETTFKTGQTYDPTNWDEQLFISYERETDAGDIVAEFAEVEQPFTIRSIEDADGGELDEFSPDPQNQQTTEISSLEDELEEIRATMLQMQEDSQDGGGGGGSGSGWSLDWDVAGVPGAAIVVGVLALIGISLANDGDN